MIYRFQNKKLITHNIFLNENKQNKNKINKKKFEKNK